MTEWQFLLRPTKIYRHSWIYMPPRQGHRCHKCVLGHWLRSWPNSDPGRWMNSMPRFMATPGDSQNIYSYPLSVAPLDCEKRKLDRNTTESDQRNQK